MTKMGCRRDPNAPRKGLNRTKTRFNQGKLKTRTKRLRPVARTERRRLEIEADRLWSEFIRLRAGGKCEVCKKPGDDPHHIRGRWDKQNRHCPGNGVYLCRKHHDKAHAKPMGFQRWVARHLPERLKGVKWGNSPVTKDRLSLIIVTLKACISALLPAKAGK